MSRRAYIPWPEKCAALICELFKISYTHAKAMDVDFVNSLIHYDHHPVPKALGGPDKFYNLAPRLIKDHREITAKRDVPMLAKARRGAKKEKAFRARLLAKAGQSEAPPKPKSRLKGRGFRGWRKFNGDVVWAEKRK